MCRRLRPSVRSPCRPESPARGAQPPRSGSLEGRGETLTPFEAATVVIGVGQVLLIAAGLLFMEAGGRRRARAEEHRHAAAQAKYDEVMAALGRRS